jgi:hypothetical protein
MLLPLLWRVKAGPYDWRTLRGTGVGCEAELYVNGKSIVVRELKLRDVSPEARSRPDRWPQATAE